MGKSAVKTFLLLFLAVLTAVSPCSAFAAEIGDSLTWELQDDGTLYISGSGTVSPFTSADLQPWKDVRDEITGVTFDADAELDIESTAYWFSGCTELAYADIPDYVQEIGYHTFYNCQSLHDLYLYYSSHVPVITQGAFVTNHPLNWEMDYDPRLQIILPEGLGNELMDLTCSYDWGSDHCPVHIQIGTNGAVLDLLSASSVRAADYCPHCKKTCSYTVAYEQLNSKEHLVRHWCSNCGADQCGGTFGGFHQMANGVCTLCGYSDGSGGGRDPVCNHQNTYKKWTDSCHWKEYCKDCGTCLQSGTQHGKYTYSPWEYHNSSHHRSLFACEKCGEGRYKYQFHTKKNQYSSCNSVQHSVQPHCSVCKSDIGPLTYENHSFRCGNWISRSSTRHSRTKTCTLCGFSTEETALHLDLNNDGLCDDCSYVMYRFSVTVPTRLSLVVSKNGKVFGAENAVISNSSTGAVSVKGIKYQAENGWKLVPYSTNMADEKVDSKEIGFRINGAESRDRGRTASIPTSGTSWRIAKSDSLPLHYDAVVSASSQPIREQVLTAVFVLGWCE